MARKNTLRRLFENVASSLPMKDPKDGIRLYDKKLKNRKPCTGSSKDK